MLKHGWRDSNSRPLVLETNATTFWATPVSLKIILLRQPASNRQPLHYWWSALANWAMTEFSGECRSRTRSTNDYVTSDFKSVPLPFWQLSIKVGIAGLEPTASYSQSTRSSLLNYIPKFAQIWLIIPVLHTYKVIVFLYSVGENYKNYPVPIRWSTRLFANLLE